MHKNVSIYIYSNDYNEIEDKELLEVIKRNISNFKLIRTYESSESNILFFFEIKISNITEENLEKVIYSLNIRFSRFSLNIKTIID
tara:strand:- start:317 stop:574 length:258 start_codon:yes stop_codon:yes gene_type:complete